MQQFSSVPEKKPHFEREPVPAIQYQQVQAQCWLERSLNQLQTRLFAEMAAVSDCTCERDIWQILVDELYQALPTAWFAVAESRVDGEGDNNSCQIVAVCQVPGSDGGIPELFMKSTGTKLCLQAETVIKIQDLLDLPTCEPVQIVPIRVGNQENSTWLLMFNPSNLQETDELQVAKLALIEQLLTRGIEACVVAIAQLQKMRSLQKYNQDLMRTNKLKNQFLANTSHEIRTPLSSIIGFTQLMIAQGFEPDRERHQEYLKIIESSGKHLLALINDILDLSKIEANQMEMQWERVELSQLCRNVFALIKEKAANKGLKLSLAIANDVTTIIADSLRLKQMLLNLLFNAVKFTTTGTVGLDVFIQDNHIHFAVWDTGTGIHQQNLTELFQPYSQIANPVVSREEGTGLGLALTRKLAELHHGSILVESQIQQGSRFTIVLPLQPPHLSDDDIPVVTKTEIASIPIPTTPSPNTKLSPNQGDILLVEDDSNNAQLIKIYLEKLGYHVTWVNNATQMWTALQQQTPELILMDIYLPDGNGLDLITQIRDRESCRYTPIIAQTAMAMKSDRDTCLNAGFDEYISKPLDLEQLANLVSKYSEPAM